MFVKPFSIKTAHINKNYRFQVFGMAHLVRAALEFNARRFRPRLIFAVFGRRLISPLHSFINLEVFEHNNNNNSDTIQHNSEDLSVPTLTLLETENISNTTRRRCGFFCNFDAGHKLMFPLNSTQLKERLQL